MLRRGRDVRMNGDPRARARENLVQVQLPEGTVELGIEPGLKVTDQPGLMFSRDPIQPHLQQIAHRREEVRAGPVEERERRLVQEPRPAVRTSYGVKDLHGPTVEPRT